MFFEFLRFELRYWLRGMMVWVFLAIFTIIFFAATVSDTVRVGSPLGNTHRNAPYVVQSFSAAMGLLSILMTTAFVDSAASRDFSTGTSALLFSKPIKRRDYLAGRFVGAILVAMIPSLGVSLGIILAGWSPWVVPERWGPEPWAAHWQSILLFVVPNTLFFGSVIFAISVLTRSTRYSFIGTILLLVGYIIAGNMLSSLENEWIATLADPLGGSAFDVATKYWTVEEKNTLTVPLTGYLLLNRVLWMSMAIVCYGFAAWRFSFEERSQRVRRVKKQAAPAKQPNITIDPVTVAGQPASFSTSIAQFRSQLADDTRTIIRSTVFVVIALAAILNMLPTVWFQLGRAYGLSTFPVTYQQIDYIRGSLYVFLMAIITFFTGVLVWRDRDYRLHEIFGALPTRNWTSYLSKLTTLVLVVAIIQCLAIGLSVCAQLALGYTRFQLSLYVREMLILDLLSMTFLIVLSLLSHTLAPNRYVGYFLFIILLVLNNFGWRFLQIDTLLVKYGRLPSHTYSDMYGFAPFVKGLAWFSLYWILFATLTAWLTTRLWQRGPLQSLRQRLTWVPMNISGSQRLTLAAIATAWVGLGAWLGYNTMVINKIITSDQAEKMQVEYEKKYSALAEKPQPRTTKVNYHIDLYPDTRNMRLTGKEVVVNKSSQAIDELYLTLDRNFQYEIQVEGASRTAFDEKLGVQTYKFEPALTPGEQRTMDYVVATNTRGIENSISNMQIVQNGTFFNNSIVPQIGYMRDAVLRDPNKRRKYGLPMVESYPELTRECTDKCMNNYVGGSADWVDVETVISTSPDQIAVAPGSLVEQWEKDGRRFSRYRLDHRSLNFYSFISARYAVQRDKVGDVDLEVYYHPDHRWNVPKMIKSMQQSLAYYTENFGPYKHKQARIIEFPRVATFAQAFPGTMPYSESIGFIANLEKPDDIDMVFYVVAHEMAHQWWAHQVIGARMQGATVLSETLAQYSALMVMEREYGRDMMRKFLRYEMDSYLRSRGQELIKEQPLLTVTPDQGYVHYRKGSVALYYLKELIGEARVNAALKEIIDQFAYHEPPYPNAYTLVDALKRHTPPELHYVLTDLFDNITLYSNRTLSATAKKQTDGKYEVTIQVNCQKLRADQSGKESNVELNELIEIGAFAKPGKRKQYGETLARQRVQVKEGEQEFKFIVDSLPETAGIDPFCLLIDRIPDDNVKRVTVQ